MKSQTVIVEGLLPKTSVSKLVYHILETTQLKKHEIGRIQKLSHKFSVEIVDQEQDDLEKVLRDLDGSSLDSHVLSAWSGDLEVDEKIITHFKNLEKWQIFEREEELKESTTLSFAKVELVDFEPSIQNSWRCDFNITKVKPSMERPPKPGQPLLLESHSDNTELICAIVIKWHTESCQLSLEQSPEAETWEGTKWNVSWNTNHAGIERALQQVQRLPFQRNECLEQLFQITLYFHQPEFKDYQPIPTLNHELNKKQCEVYTTCLEQGGLHLIQGPPGTGKSKVLLELLKAFHREQKRVLVAASTHAAVDHLLQHCDLPEKDVLRLGHPSRISAKSLPSHLEYKWQNSESFKLYKKLNKDHREIKKQFLKTKGDEKKLLLKDLRELEKSIQDCLKQGKDYLLDLSHIVFTTHTGFQPQFLKGYKFDVVLIDEAAQCSEIDIWLTLPYAKKWILAGDPCQLPTLIKSPKAKGLAVSLMERLSQNNYPIHLLEEQYRMHPDIAEYSSQVFYDHKLLIATESQRELLAFPCSSDHLFWHDAPQIFIDTAGSESEESLVDHSYHNTYEANFIYRRVQECLDAGVQANEIGIITPYSAQTLLLKSHFKNEELEISSVDSFQGREKTIIFISCVRSNHDGQIGFLSDTRRMNVALTRAKKLCVVIGDSATLSTHPFYEGYIQHKENTRGLHSVWEWSE